MKISVVVCTYNYAHLLPDALRTIAAQTVSDFELLIVDDGSTDNTEEVVQQHRSRFHNCRYLKRPHAGPADARNAGVQAATGSHVAFLDADDLWSPDYLRAFQEAFNSNPRAELAFCEGTIIRTQNGVITKAALHRELPPLRGPVRSPSELFAVIRSFSPSGMVFSKALYGRTGPFDVRSFGWFSEDIDWTFRALMGGAFCICVKRRLYLYRRHEGNLTNKAGDSFQSWLTIYSQTLAQSRRDRQVEALARSIIRSHSVRFLPTCPTSEGRDLLRRALATLGGDFMIRVTYIGTYLGLVDLLKFLKQMKRVFSSWFGKKLAIDLNNPSAEVFKELETQLLRIAPEQNGPTR